jgi:hypothetical protein
MCILSLGNSLEECYAAVGAVGNYWLDVIDAKGSHMDDEELMELISERKTISKTIDDYEGRKATSLTTAGRLADFLGAEMVKDKGLNCNLIISRLPAGAPVTERAIPGNLSSSLPIYIYLQLTISNSPSHFSFCICYSLLPAVVAAIHQWLSLAPTPTFARSTFASG